MLSFVIYGKMAVNYAFFDNLQVNLLSKFSRNYKSVIYDSPDSPLINILARGS